MADADTSKNTVPTLGHYRPHAYLPTDVYWPHWLTAQSARPITASDSVLVLNSAGLSGADLGFGKGGCPIHQKGAPRRKARWRCALPGVRRANPENWKFRTLRCIFPAFRGTTTYMIECAFMVFCRQYCLYIIDSDNRPKWRLVVDSINTFYIQINMMPRQW